MKSDNKTIRAMQLVIPAMILCFIGDYCIGIEPADSTSLDSIASSGWLTIADWRIAVSNSFGMIGSILYAIGAVYFAKFIALVIPCLMRICIWYSVMRVALLLTLVLNLLMWKVFS